jgi:hypothetical protein
MAHDHAHPHDNTYYLDQLCTIAACGALGGVAILMYWLPGPDGKTKLGYILTPQFFTPVLLGGVALLALVVIRAVTLWQTAGRTAAHTHDHDHHHHDHAHDHHHHDHTHGHDHRHHAHAHAHTHDHGHDHGWTPARYAVLMLPIVLYFLNLPNSSFSAEWYKDRLTSSAIEGGGTVTSKDGVVLGFKELANAAYFPETRQAMEGKTGKLAGMFSPVNAKEFTLFRVKMNCCAADAIPVEVRIISDENITAVNPKDWVEVEGQIQFRKVVGREKYLPVLYVKAADQVKRIPPQADYGLD